MDMASTPFRRRMYPDERLLTRIALAPLGYNRPEFAQQLVPTKVTRFSGSQLIKPSSGLPAMVDMLLVFPVFHTWT